MEIRGRSGPSGEGGAAANTPGRAVGASAWRLAGAARSAACRRPSLASPRDPLRAGNPSARPPGFSAPSHQHGLLRRPCALFLGGPLSSAPQAGLQGVRAEPPCAAGADAGRCGPARRLLSSPPHAGPHRLRAASRIASASPCSLFACARYASSRVPKARQRTAPRGARSQVPHHATTGPPTRDGGRRRGGPRANGGARAGATMRDAARTRGGPGKGGEVTSRRTARIAPRPRPQRKLRSRTQAAMPRGPLRRRQTARLRSRSVAEPPRASLRSKIARSETVPESGGKASARRVRDGIARRRERRRE